MIAKATKLGSCVTNQKVIHVGFTPAGKRTRIISSEPPVSTTE